MPWTSLLAYGAPAFGYAFYLFFIQFYFLKFSTDVLLASPAVMGALFGLGRLWDAVSDPLIGYWSDRTDSSWGRRRPWMFLAIPALAVTFYMVWNPPRGLSDAALVAWSAVALFGFFTAYTAYVIPHVSLGAELTLDHHERNRVFGAHRAAFILGMMGAFVGIGYATAAEDGRVGATTVAVVGLGIASLMLLPAPVALRERPAFQGRGARSPYGALRDVLANRPARAILLAQFLEGLGGGVLGVLAPYVTEYVFRRPDLIAIVPAFFVVSGVLALPLWIMLSRRLGKRTVWRIALVGNAVFFGATFFVQPNQLVFLCVLLAGAGASAGCGGAIGTSMLADTIDLDEHRSGERKEGAYSAAWGFAIKTSIAAVIVLTGVVLQLSGFQPNVEQTPTAEFALRAMFAGAPLFAALTGIWALGRYDLDEKTHRRIRRELDERIAARRTKAVD